ncbi:MAG: hypothetical protein ACI9A2_001660, partial [Halioglobus sp.]
MVACLQKTCRPATISVTYKILEGVTNACRNHPGMPMRA